MKVIYHGIEMTTSVAQMAYAELRAGDSVEEHYHDSLEEVFLKIEGECELNLDGVLQLFKKEDGIGIAPKIKHKLKAFRDAKLYFFGVSTL
ncbi:MAG: cupin domain-containing protein [Flammeovirgaceae bacterium]|nr:cupin domain-containing protein [Flammeovirgaceae bacterium]